MDAAGSLGKNMDGFQAQFRILHVTIFCVLILLSFSRNSFANCVTLSQPEPLLPQTEHSPRNRLLEIGIVEVKVSWNTCKGEGHYVLILQDSRGKKRKHTLKASQRLNFSTILLLKAGESYLLSLQQTNRDGKILEKSEKMFHLNPPPEGLLPKKSSVKRELASVANSFSNSGEKSRPWAEAYAGLGFISYRSSLATENDRFSLPAINAGFQTTRAQGVGASVDFLQSLGSKSISATNSVKSYFSYLAGVNYKFALNDALTLAPFIQLSQFFLNLSSSTNSQVNSLRYLGAGAKIFWTEEKFRLATTLSYAPSLGSSTALSRLELGLRPGFQFAENSRVEIPISYQLYSGSTAYGSTRLSTLSAAGVYALAW